MSFRGVMSVDGTDYRVSVTEDPHLTGETPVRGSRTYYDALGRVTKTERVTNLVFSVSTNGEVLTVSVSGGGVVPGTVTTTGYDSAGRVAATTNGVGQVTSYLYDSADRRVTVTQGDENSLYLRSHTGYDLSGNAVQSWQEGVNTVGGSPATGPVSKFVYDELNRVVISGLGLSPTNDTIDLPQHFTWYDVLGRKQAEADGETNLTTYGYDGLGHLVAVASGYSWTNAVNVTVTRYTVNEVGELLQVTDATNRVTTFEYDGLGRRKSRTMPGNEQEFWTYYADGNVKQHQDFLGTNVVYTYDTRGRLVNKQKVGDTNPYVSFTYYGDGQRHTMVDGVTTNTYSYDAADRLWIKSNPLAELTYLYNGNGQVTNASSDNFKGYHVAYGYDWLGRLAASTNRSIAWSYDVLGRLSESADRESAVE